MFFLYSCFLISFLLFFFFFQAEDGIRDYKVTGVQTCALPILHRVALLVRDAHQQVVEELTIELEIPYLAARISQPTRDDVGVRSRAKNLTERIESDHSTPGQIAKRRNIQWDAIVEEASAAFEQCFPIAGQGQHKTSARRCVDRVRDRIAVESQSQVKGEPARE